MHENGSSSNNSEQTLSPRTLLPRPVGRLRAGVLYPDGHIEFLPWSQNEIMNGCADAMARLAVGDLSAVPAGMYFHFTNDPDSWVEPGPTDPARAMEHYAGLEPPEDYIRAPLQGSLTKFSSNAELYTANAVRVLAGNGQAVGLTNGLTFSGAAGSAVVGASVVSVPDWDDPSQDIIWNQGYIDTILPATSSPHQTVVQWELLFR